MMVRFNKDTILIVLIDIMLESVVRARPFRDGVDCKHANDKDLEKEFKRLNRGLDIRTLFLNSDWTDKTIENQFRVLRAINQEDATRSGCLNTTIKSNRPLLFRSVCPWTIEEHVFDNQTYPRSVFWAKSRCSNCIGMHNKMCEAIKYKIHILKRSRTCNTNGVWDYEKTDFYIPIAYTCAQAREIENSHQVTPQPLVDLPIPV